MITLQTILDKITTHEPKILPVTPVSAAVLVLLMEGTAGDLFFIITKRPQSITTYAGDYCFPGGLRDPSDTDLRETAFREAEEEMSLTPAHYRLIHSLDDFQDRHDNLVRPFVALITQQEFEARVKLSSDEVEKLYYFPVADLLAIERDARLEQVIGIQPTYSYLKEDVFIWGLTARILVQLGNLIYGLDKPTTKKRR